MTQQLLRGAAGRKPDVPEFTSIDPDEVNRGTISSWSDMLDDAGAVAGKETRLTQESLIASLERAIPGYRNMVSSATGKISDLLSGKVSKDVGDRLANLAASRAKNWGMGKFSGLARNLEMRDFGLNSMDAVQKGLESFQGFMRTMSDTAVAKPMRPSSIMLTAQQRLAHLEQERTSRFNRDLYESEIGATGDPLARLKLQMEAQSAGMRSSSFMQPDQSTRAWQSMNYQTNMGGLASRSANRSPISFSNFGAGGAGGHNAAWGIDTTPVWGDAEATWPVTPSYGGMPHQGRDDELPPVSKPLYM